MSQRTLKAPGVEIIEHDLSGYTTTNIGTGCLITGFAQKGEDLEPMKITNRSSWLLNFGAPTNEAEEYFYNAGMEVLNQGGFLYAAKIPYANDIAGIYAASKFTISKNVALYNFDEESGMLYEWGVDETGQPEKKWASELEGDDSELYNINGTMYRFIKNYKSMKDLGLNHLQLIAPSAQDFLSKDLVEEYETGESKPGSNVIYLVDKTRAVYTRAPEIADKQENRDSRYCIGIVPVITTMCNTAYFQKKSTGVTSDVPELYQPVRSLKTITFPAGAASAAEYLPTKFVAEDLHTQLMTDNDAFKVSLSERAATIAQSCLVNGNLVDGKFKPFIANDVAVVVFKAFVSTEDGKIDFEPVETWVGSLDPNGRDEKGRTTFIDSIINNNSEYIYCFSNLENPQQVLNPDHGFVAGSDSEFNQVKQDVENNTEYQAATLFSAYTAKMLGFGSDYTPSEYDLAAPRDFTYELDTSASNPGRGMQECAISTMGALIQFYNEDAKQPICALDELVYGGKLDSKALSDLTPVDDTLSFNGYMGVSDKFITKLPTVDYKIRRRSKTKDGYDIKSDEKGSLTFEFLPKQDRDDYRYESYDYQMLLGKYLDKDGNDVEQSDYRSPNITTMPLSELTILNSTDYLRAIYDFENLVDVKDLCEQCGVQYDAADEEFFNSDQWALCRQKAIQSLIINSIEKSGRFKARLRYLMKAKINLDRLDNAYEDAQSEETSASAKEARKIGRKYIEDLYKSYSDIGLLNGISFNKVTSDSGD